MKYPLRYPPDNTNLFLKCQKCKRTMISRFGKTEGRFCGCKDPNYEPEY